MLKPRSIAFVGLSDSNPFTEYVEPTLDSGANVFFVHPKHESVFGRKTHASLTSIGQPIDVVMSVMSARRTTELVEEAADLDVGGVVLVAGGFAEAGPEGAALQKRLRAAATRSGMGIVGPNGLGFVNVPHGISLTIASKHKRRPGGISVVSQSGAVLSGVAMAAWDRPGTGINLLISAGNEVSTDLADYVDYFATDPETRAIGLVVEQIRRPDAFFAAASRAMAAGKPVVVLKLARNARSQQMAASHTGALTGDAWVYDIAFEQNGIGLARDPEELVDRLSLFEQLDPDVRSDVRNLGVITMTGGFASLTVDVAADERVELPALPGFQDWLDKHLPGVTVPNPLDTTGLGGPKWPEIVAKYGQSEELDALMFIHPLADEDESVGRAQVERFIEEAGTAGRPFVVANCSGALGQFVVDRVRASGHTAMGHGMRGTIRGLRTLGDFHRHRYRDRAANTPVEPVVRPSVPSIPQPEGPMLPFRETMELLRTAGIPTAPYTLVPPEASAEAIPGFDGPYVVKLADVGHRTEHGAVRLNVSGGDLALAVGDMRSLAARKGLAPTVAVQAMVEPRGEAFLGIQGDSELGSLVVFGLGGVFVEVLRRVGGRMAPFNRSEALGLIAEFEDTKVMHGFRGQPAWDLEALADILVSAGQLAASTRPWISSLDINPLIYGDEGFLAVDALCLIRPDT